MQLTNQIHFQNPRGDLFGGVTAAVFALPMALAFGVTFGAGAIAGLWGAVLVVFCASLFGGMPTLISEPMGKYVTMMPYTVISGFMSGIGIILVILQFAPFLGQASPPGSVGTLQSIPALLGNMQPTETILAAVLTIENAVKEALEKGRHVFIMEAKGQTWRRLENLKFLSLLPPNHLLEGREETLRDAAAVVSPDWQAQPVDYGTSPAFS